jgi:type IV secretion system protein VirB10
MASKPHKPLLRLAAANDQDPRESQGAEVIDLATRTVLPSVTQRRPKSDALGLAAGIAVVGILGAVTFWSLDNARTVESRPSAQAAQAPAAPAPVGTAPAPQPGPPAATAQPAPPQSAPQPAPQQSAVLSAPPQAAPMASPMSNPASSPTVIFDASALPTAIAAPPLTAPAPPASGGSGNDDFANRIGGVGGGKAVASASINPKTTVTQGTLIPAILETAIDTDVPGYVRAVVSTDVRSFDGGRVLVPRSSRLIGQYKSGLQAGQKRAYVIWTRLIRPDGVTVDIASPAIGFGGETGLSGKVDSNFFARFGSSMLLSVIGGLSTLGGNAGVVLGGGQSAAAAAVGQTGQIGPTIRIRQGQPVRVFTARDLDFSKVSTQ